MRPSLLLLLALPLTAQTPAFEVASIRPSTSLVTPMLLCGSHKLNTESSLASVVYRLDILFSEAYEDLVDDFDLPQWTRNTGTYAVSVKIPPNTSVATCRHMLRNLLAERFHAVTDVETRDVLRYYLKVAKSGLKLKPVAGPPADLSASSTFEVQGGVTRHTYRGAPMSKILTSLGATTYIEAFALEFHLASVGSLIDETGLNGYYDGAFELAYSVASRRNEFAESLPDALTRQLGLTLELRKTPGKVLVLRSSDRTPTEN